MIGGDDEEDLVIGDDLVHGIGEGRSMASITLFLTSGSFVCPASSVTLVWTWMKSNSLALWAIRAAPAGPGRIVRVLDSSGFHTQDLAEPMVNSAGGDHQPLHAPLIGKRLELSHHPGPLGPDGVDRG